MAPPAPPNTAPADSSRVCYILYIVKVTNRCPKFNKRGIIGDEAF